MSDTCSLFPLFRDPWPSCLLPSHQHQGLFQWVSIWHHVAKVLEFQLQHQSFQWVFRTDFLQDGLVWSPCSPRNSQESSPTPQFKSINSSVLSFLYSPTLTSTCDYWKNSFDYTDWEGNRHEGQGSPNGGNRLQVSDIFISLKRQEETNYRYFFLIYTNLKGSFS